MMNRLKSVSCRRTWCQLKRLQSSLSSSSSKVQIPPRIERGPTDILKALESTVPKDLAKDGIYQDDCFLLPTRKGDYRAYALAYESGKRTAMWIHREHSELFPKNLSEPKIEAFMPPVKYTDKDQVSEEILLKVILEGDASNAYEIYNLLEGNVSNETKQALLEVMCFYDGTTSKVLPLERWFGKPQQKAWLNHPGINVLYQFLIKQDAATAAAAHNALLCGLIKGGQFQEAWLLYEKCQKEDIPLNVTTYNYVMEIIAEVENNVASNKKQMVYDILNAMNAKGLKPNVRTLNAALRVACSIRDFAMAQSLVKHLFTEFRRLKIKFSLASYYCVGNLLYRRGEKTCDSFMDLLEAVSKEEFTFQDPRDKRFFGFAMNAARTVYCSKEAADKVHKILLTGNNSQFVTSMAHETGYYNHYTRLQLSTSTIEEFFQFYERTIPDVYIPDSNVVVDILSNLQSYSPEAAAKYLPRLWSDAKLFGYADCKILSGLLDLMGRFPGQPESPLKEAFVDVAAHAWNYIKEETEKEVRNPIESTMMGNMAQVFLKGDQASRAGEVLAHFANNSSMFMPTMNMVQMNELLESCVTAKCFGEAILVMQCAEKSGSFDVTEMARRLYNIPDIDDEYREKVVALVGSEKLLEDKSGSN